MAGESFDVKAFYSALDAQRISRDLTWKDVSEQSGVSQSTLSRLSQGRGPGIDGLALLLAWSGLDVSSFIPDASPVEPLAQITASLRADHNLSPESARALEEIVKVAYQQFRGR